jgi:hypothetical protein
MWRIGRSKLGDSDSAPRLLDRRFQTSTSTSCVGMDRTEGRRDLDHRAVALPGGPVISSLPAHGLLQLVRSDSAVRRLKIARNARGCGSVGWLPVLARSGGVDRLAWRARRRYAGWGSLRARLGALGRSFVAGAMGRRSSPTLPSYVGAHGRGKVPAMASVLDGAGVRGGEAVLPRDGAPQSSPP